MTEYRIIEALGGDVVVGLKRHCNNKQAATWLLRQLECGVIAGIPVKLQKRMVTDEEADRLPPLSNGQRQSAWETI